METIFSFNINTRSTEETRNLGRNIGDHVTPGIVIALFGDLGSGKTVFVQGLAKGLDISEDYYITSPTYTLINKYIGRCPLFHVDLYRISSVADIDDIGLSENMHGDGVAAIEWADRIPKSLLAHHISLHFDIIDDTSRKITIGANGPAEIDLIRNIAKNRYSPSSLTLKQS